MAQITSAEWEFPIGTVAHNPIYFYTDEFVSPVYLSEITVEGDGTFLMASSFGGNGLIIRVTTLVSSGTVTVTLNSGFTIPSLDRDYVWQFTWTASGQIPVATDISPDPPATPTITVDDSDLDYKETATVAVTFTRAVEGFDVNDVTVVGGTISNFTGSGASYSFTLTPPESASGTITIDVPAGDDWLAATQVSVVYDTIVTERIITLETSSIGIVHDTTATITVRFSDGDAITGFTQSDITVTGSSITNFVTAGTEGVVWRFDVTAPSSGAGEIEISIAEGVITNTEGNLSATLTVYYGTAPMITGISNQVIVIPLADGTYANHTVVNGQYKSDAIVVTGVYSELTVKGLLEGFSYDVTRINAGTVNVNIFGEALEEVLTDKTWAAEAFLNDENMASVDIDYSVVYGPPVIDVSGVNGMDVSRGSEIGDALSIPNVDIETGFNIPISNRPSNTVIRGDLVGLEFFSHAGGVVLYGTIPTGPDFTLTELRFTVETTNSNPVGPVTADFVLNLV